MASQKSAGGDRHGETCGHDEDQPVCAARDRQREAEDRIEIYLVGQRPRDEDQRRGTVWQERDSTDRLRRIRRQRLPADAGKRHSERREQPVGGINPHKAPFEELYRPRPPGVIALRPQHDKAADDEEHVDAGFA